MNYSLTKLESGLRVMTIPMPSLESATVTIWVKTGSRNEEKRVAGISHFLEHMVFKGSKKRPTAREISEAVDSIGGEFNAATSKDWTNFYIKSGVGSIETAMDVLSDMVFNPLLKPEEIEREKGTIIQEIAMYEDTPIMKIGEVYEELAFGDSPLGRDTAGEPESVKKIQKSDFLRYRERYYYPENIIVTVAGGVTENTSVRLAEKYFQKLQITNNKPQTNSNLQFTSKQVKPQVKLQTKKTDQAHFILGYMGQGRGYKGRFAQSVLASILGGGMSSRLFIEVRERRGLAYSVRTSLERYDEVGYIGTYVGTDPKKIEECIKIVLEEHYKISNLKLQISNKELTKAKEFMKGHLALALEDTKDVTDFFGEQELFLPKVMTPEEISKKIDAVSLEDVYFEAKNLFNPAKLNLAIIGPFTKKEKFVQLLA